MAGRRVQIAYDSRMTRIRGAERKRSWDILGKDIIGPAYPLYFALKCSLGALRPTERERAAYAVRTISLRGSGVSDVNIAQKNGFCPAKQVEDVVD